MCRRCRHCCRQFGLAAGARLQPSSARPLPCAPRHTPHWPHVSASSNLAGGLPAHNNQCLRTSDGYDMARSRLACGCVAHFNGVALGSAQLGPGLYGAHLTRVSRSQAPALARRCPIYAGRWPHIQQAAGFAPSSSSRQTPIARSCSTVRDGVQPRLGATRLAEREQLTHSPLWCRSHHLA